MTTEKYEELFGMEACMDSVKFEAEVLNANPFDELGRSIIRNEQDPLFNSRMIDAWKAYILENGIKWNDRKEESA